MRRLPAALLLTLCAVVWTAPAHAATVRVSGGGSTLVLDTALDEYEDGQLAVSDAHGRLEASLDPSSDPLLRDGLAVLRVASTRVAGRLVDDPLPPLAHGAQVDGDAHLVVRVDVPADAAPGVHGGLLHLTLDGQPLADVPVQLDVWNVQLPARDDRSAFRTLFQVTPQSYINAVDARTGDDPREAGPVVGDSLMRFLSQYRIGPGDWGYGTPRRTGYRDGRGWWRAAASLMRSYGSHPFPAMRLPIDTQRAARPLTGLSPSRPATWLGYLRRYVVPFWQRFDWLDRAVAWGWDEPGDRLDRSVVGPQACAIHRAVPGAQYMVTDTPRTPRPARRVRIPWGQGSRVYRLKAEGGDNRFLWDGRGCDDVDIWVILSRRFYGTFATPLETAAHLDSEHTNQRLIDTARRRGAQIWSYTYEGVPGSPGYSVGEPAGNPRLFLLWNALEGLDGTLYADGMMSYGGRNPYRSLTGRGQHVLLYPAFRTGEEPVSSLRLEGIRDGIEDADLARLLVARRGRAALLRIVAREHLFSVEDGKVQLACTMGCDLPGRTKFSFPRYRTDAGTPAALERVHRALLAALGNVPAGSS